jgi:5'-nucleotidase
MNFPNIPFSKIKGVRVSRQGFRMYTDKVAERLDNRGKPYFWMGGSYAGFKPIEGSDCEVLDKGYISLTPCRLDITQFEFMATLNQWELDPILDRFNKRKSSKSKSKSAKSSRRK